jgi:hypothetical protein
VTYTLYRFYNAEGRLLYVGWTSRALVRWVEHTRYQPWWSEVSHIRVEHLPTADDAREAEIRAIRNENPLYNVVRMDGRKSLPTGVYRRWGEGSVFIQRNNNTWQSSIWWMGKKHRFYGGRGETGKAKATALLEAFRQKHGIVAIEQ